MNKVYYVKSCEEDLSTKTLIGEKKEICQTLEEIVTNKFLKCNTKSFGQEQRLSTTILNENYLKTYRSQGVIFETDEKPDYVLPFDIVLVSDAKNIITHYYRIKDNLHIYYNHQLIKGYEKFIFNTFDEFTNKFKSPLEAWKAVNEFRVSNNYKKLPKEKFRACAYNETVFIRPISIKPVALFGYKKKVKDLARKLNIPWYRSAKEFYINNI
jgi:hypothetical protein